MVVDLQKLQLAMARACMSSANLRKSAGVSDVTLCKIQNGTQEPRPSTLGRIAKALNVDPGELIEIREEVQ